MSLTECPSRPSGLRIPRSSGLLLHPTSLPGRFGVGDLGPEAFAFVDFLHAAGQSWWQILPYGPTDSGFHSSPYMAFSAFAGSPLLISLERLIEDGLITDDDLSDYPDLSGNRVDFDTVFHLKNLLLRKAASTFDKRGGAESFDSFCRQEAPWLDDYSLFMALKTTVGNCAWSDWPSPLALRDPDALEEARNRLAKEIDFHRFVQFCFDCQWKALRRHAASQGVRIIGDLPIYVAYDSVDVWAHRRLFDLDPETGRPNHVAGVPPDYFSQTGQRWGNPLYRWVDTDGRPTEGLGPWWVARIRKLLEHVDLLRVDHFRGFEAYWEIPAGAETAQNGRWVKGPGEPFFSYLAWELGSVPFIAEDLGVITDEVIALREELKLPGMKILQFAFGSGPDNPYLPFNFENTHAVIYTGTHDNDTLVGWYRSALSDEQRRNLLEYVGAADDGEIHWALIRYAMSSVACLAIFPVQDILGLPSDCRMNTPGTTTGNWAWRMEPGSLTSGVAERLRRLTRLYRRLSQAS